MPPALLGSASLLVWSTLLAGPPKLPAAPGEPAPAPVVQQPAPAETAPAPATAPAPDTGETAPAPEPAPVVDQPVAPLAPFEAPGAPMPEPELAPLVDDVSTEAYITVRPPQWRGSGQLIAAGSLFVAAVAFQAGDTAICGDCATGVFERILLFTSMGLAGGGGVARGHADAYDDTALRRERPDTRRALIAGAVLTGVGAAIGLVNEGLWWHCVIEGGAGPYEATNSGDVFENQCRMGVNRAMIDVATASTGTGLALLGWSLTYRRDAKAYERARVIGLRPNVGRDRFGIGLQGRF